MSTIPMGYISEVDFSQRSAIRAVSVWGLAAIFYFYELMLLVSPSVMTDDLTLTFKTSAEQLGNLSAFYYYAYALMQIPVGLLMDRFGPRILLTLAAAFCTLGCLIFAFAPVLWIAALGRFVMGVGGSFAVVGCLKLASLWFPVNRFALLTGIMVAVGMMGGVFGQEHLVKLVLMVGWRDTILYGALLGGLLSIVIWIVVSDQPFKMLQTNDVVENSKSSILKGLLQVMKIPQVWIASLYAGLMFVPTTGFGQLWGVPYFVERFHIEKDVAGGMVSMIFYGWALGGPLYGLISDWIARRKSPMAFAALATLIVMTAILYAPVSMLQMKILMFLLGAFSSGFILAFSVVREINTPILTGTAIGFINTLNNASGALAQPVVGKLLDKQWNGQVSADGSPVYTLAMYNEALLFLPICLVIAFVILPFIRETFCRPTSTQL
ncbi:MFS transporter [Candidatus Berkiella aquae]|uniref:Lysosomal dipeptide transporter MFSD1 n=1 Tax=Candidatus Berkiella aquae TaxID=295108 RepID=A0A0Q9YZS8_9GAMM|nr:MFS transporter [Candidatus Berkiella aquae]MCS5712520.1 MFS transporter [Candidatus Berkiella aquae]